MATVHASRMDQRTECAWEDCEASPSTMLAIPLCDRHAIAAYRAVNNLLSTTPKALTDMLASTMPERILGKAAPRPDRTRRNVRTTPGRIYFARADGLIKIGYSTNVRQRMANLGHEVIVTIPGTMEDEKALHHRFGEYWHHGEYFTPGSQLVEYIDTLMGGDLQIPTV
jgi:hypothetical protein